VFEASGGIRCSIGITEGQLTAKYCALWHFISVAGGVAVIANELPEMSAPRSANAVMNLVIKSWALVRLR
ncbi:hypothetical protein, partial [Cysteiniphilum litorale]|uniref:hypothetical protein n=1 Tax=Cysteiniphilum litorale TaxID=2056700 RepID=UPI003F8816D6